MRHNALTLKLAMAAKLSVLQTKIQEASGLTKEQVREQTVVSHTFLNGTYTRVAQLPAGYAGVGEIHRFPNLTTILKGSAVVVSDNQSPRLVVAGDQYVVPANNRNAFLAITDFKFSTTHRTDKTTVEEVEEELLIPTVAQQFEELRELLNFKG